MKIYENSNLDPFWAFLPILMVNKTFSEKFTPLILPISSILFLGKFCEKANGKFQD